MARGIRLRWATGWMGGMLRTTWSLKHLQVVKYTANGITNQVTSGEREGRQLLERFSLSQVRVEWKFDPDQEIWHMEVEKETMFVWKTTSPEPGLSETLLPVSAEHKKNPYSPAARDIVSLLMLARHLFHHYRVPVVDAWMEAMGMHLPWRAMCDLPLAGVPQRAPGDTGCVDGERRNLAVLTEMNPVPSPGFSMSVPILMVKASPNDFMANLNIVHELHEESQITKTRSQTGQVLASPLVGQNYARSPTCQENTYANSIHGQAIR
ncbi:hypothetical protein DFH09DRAFT_1078896 [Mycena vulgaris]|nr:hypothetical protein DFH09DRAFT_1078896 [Mycena vulgaris]